MAATRLPDVPLHDGVGAPRRHGAAPAHDGDGGLRRRGARLARAAARRTAGRVASSGTSPGPRPCRGERRADRAEPGGPPVRRRLHVDATRSADVLAPLLLDSCGASSTPSTRSRSGTAGRRRASCPTWRSPSRATSTSRRTRSTPTRPTTSTTARGCTGGRPRSPTQGGVGVYLGDTDFTRRQDRFRPTTATRRLEAIRAERDPERPLRVVPDRRTRRG